MFPWHMRSLVKQRPSWGNKLTLCHLVSRRNYRIFQILDQLSYFCERNSPLGCFRFVRGNDLEFVQVAEQVNHE